MYISFWEEKTGIHTGMILVDLKEAFDTSDQTALLWKMECIGFKETVIKACSLFYSFPKESLLIIMRNAFYFI